MTRPRISGATGLVTAVILTVFGASSAHAGGDVLRVKIHAFRTDGDYGARFVAVVAPDEQALPGGCRELEVRARYAWWKWWWDDVAGRVSRQSHVAALKILEDAAARGDLVGFGYVGTGWRAPEPSQPCSVISNALIESRDVTLRGTKTSVLSFFTAP